MFRFVSPAGAPVKLTQIVRALHGGFFINGEVEDGLRTMALRLKVRSVLPTSSGRAAFYLILKGLQRLRPNRDVVAVPAYTCFSVAASVVRTGLKLHPVDIDPKTLDVDLSELEALPKERLLCILTSNLFGLVNDLARIEKVARTKGAFLVDDAAQALGASRDGRLAGTFGDVGFYSFGRGKVLGGVGGLVVTNSEEIERAIQAEATITPAPSSAHTVWKVLEMLTQSIFLHPRLYWIPNSLPFLKLGITEFAPDFPIARLPRFAAALVPQLMDGLREINHVRRRNAAAMSRDLEGNPNFTRPKPAPNSQPTYIRFPILAKDENTRKRALVRLRAAGIGASAFYPSAICDIPGIDVYMAPDNFHRPRAEDLSRRLLTLPTHPFVRAEDLERMAEILNEA